MGSRWRLLVILVAASVVALYGLLWCWARPVERTLGISQHKYARLTVGTTDQEALKILGRPSEIARRSPSHPSLRMWIPFIQGGEEHPVAQQAEQVWRWQNGVQTVGVVFDDRGRAVYKWVDY